MKKFHEKRCQVLDRLKYLQVDPSMRKDLEAEFWQDVVTEGALYDAIAAKRDWIDDFSAVDFLDRLLVVNAYDGMHDNRRISNARVDILFNANAKGKPVAKAIAAIDCASPEEALRMMKSVMRLNPKLTALGTKDLCAINLDAVDGVMYRTYTKNNGCSFPELLVTFNKVDHLVFNDSNADSLSIGQEAERIYAILSDPVKKRGGEIRVEQRVNAIEAADSLLRRLRGLSP